MNKHLFDVKNVLSIELKERANDVHVLLLPLSSTLINQTNNHKQILNNKQGNYGIFGERLKSNVHIQNVCNLITI